MGLIRDIRSIAESLRRLVDLLGKRPDLLRPSGKIELIEYDPAAQYRREREEALLSPPELGYTEPDDT